MSRQWGGVQADSPSVNPDNINIDFKIKKLFNSRQELKYQEDILDEVIDGITDKLSTHILNSIDVPEQVKDPEFLVLNTSS